MPGTLRLRWVGHLAIFVALVLLLTACKSALVHVFLSRWSDGAQYLADKILRFAVYLIASAIMARLESKSIAAYGLPVTRTLVPRFIRGAVISFLGLTAFLLLSRAAGLFHFGSVVIGHDAADAVLMCNPQTHRPWSVARQRRRLCPMPFIGKLVLNPLPSPSAMP